MDIHKSAVISPKAEIGKDVVIGPFAVIEEDVVIDDGTSIGSSVLVASGTRLGKNCRVFHSAVLGTVPQDLKFGGEKTTLEIGDNTTIREFATLNRGTTDHWKTVVGSNCLLMAYTHVAHDCTIGNNVVMANCVNLAGHVTIEDNVGIGGLCPIHQFVRIGQHTFLGGGYRVPKDVPPYILAMGEPLRYGGLNRIGLKRRGFSDETLNLLKKSYRIIYQTNLNLKDALQKVEDDVEPISEVKEVVSFFRKSERGVIR
ncbi:MAG: acyl-ACP--UDP-N-acetylglucosamine O-acyltransferase [Calditrichales bacterium]|nr:MAG: acyl-ACP--UDP-N-acetylglucosamine O-acyltransferase [Calditrichales bacterium]